MTQCTTCGPRYDPCNVPGLTKTGLQSSLSYAMTTKDNQIVAVRIADIVERPHAATDKKDASDNTVESGIEYKKQTKKLSGKAKMIFDILNKLETKMWELIDTRIQRLFRIQILSVDRNFTRRGIARKLTEYNIEEAQRMGCEGVMVEATSFKTQNLFAELGYQLICDINHKDWTTPDGNQIFSCDDHHTTSSKLFYKPLPKL
ncbi:hypothetical protein AB6A40_008110 [Gnathostoma spinigerum]|uniref:N-acetyltransferase domain-containing protein n=1 Tax=Gnathostoma spinigerum TaxID=75299 RepID=A0ABD6EVB0_9BILA